MSGRSFHILYVDAGSPQAQVAAELLNGQRKRLVQVFGNDEALAYLRAAEVRRPDLILLNLPRQECRAALVELKRDDLLRRIPVVVMGPGGDREEVLGAYDCFANCYVSSPSTVEDFKRVLQALEEFWFSVAKLPGP